MSKQIGHLCLVLFIITAMITSAGCTSSGNGQGATIVVTVSGQTNSTLSGVTVVLGDSRGTMKQYGTTDSNGQISFADAPVNATVTAALSCLYTGATVTTYSLDFRYDVNGPVNLLVDDCPPSTGSSTGSTTLGTLTLNVTNEISGITQNEVSTSHLLFMGYPGLITQQTITITPHDLQDDGKLSIFVIGKDANNTSIGYGYVLDLTFIDGMTVNIAVDQPMSYLQYQISNISPTTSLLSFEVIQFRTGKGSMWLGDYYNLSSALTAMTVNVPYIQGFGDQFFYSVSAVSYDFNTFVFSNQDLSVGPIAPPLSNQSFDLNQALAAPKVTVSGTNTPTPTLSWSGVDPAATMIRASATFRLSSTYVNCSYDNMSVTRNSITFPELPDSLAAFRPTAVIYFSVNTVGTLGGVNRSSGGSYSGF